MIVHNHFYYKQNDGEIKLKYYAFFVTVHW